MIINEPVSLKELFESTSFGKYPTEPPSWKSRVSDVLNNPTDQTAKCFIDGIFHSRGKNAAFDFGVWPGQDLYERNLHSFSVFLLGIRFQSYVKSLIEQRLEEETGFAFEFDYPWFLASLYHDITTTYKVRLVEQQNNEVQDVVSILKNSVFEVTYALYQDNLQGFNCTFTDNTYSCPIINNYFRWRNGYDHGIVAGYVLYDRLLNNYENTWNGIEQNNTSFNKGDFETESGNLKWRKEQLWVFGYVADAIVAHNIWHVDEADIERVEKYKKANLEWLVHAKDDSTKKLSREEHALAFYLGFIDTIEPIKYFSDKVEVPVILDNILMCVQVGKLVISQKDNILNFRNWYENKLKGMELWLKDVRVRLTEDETIEIASPGIML